MPQGISITRLIDVNQSRAPAREIADEKTFSIRRPIQRVETGPTFYGEIAHCPVTEGQDMYLIFPSLENSNALPIGRHVPMVEAYRLGCELREFTTFPSNGVENSEHRPRAIGSLFRENAQVCLSPGAAMAVIKPS